jgi:hypothetical protein
VRMGSHALTTVTRLSVQNRLLRAGASAALEELDTWRTWDDPDDVARQQLRADGEPFHPLALAPGDPLRWDDADTTLDADQSDPRCWFRGSGVVSNGLDGVGIELPYGDYALSGRSDHPVAARRWSARMQRDLLRHLGYYGLLELMPGNTIFSWFGEDHLVPAEFHDAFAGYTAIDRLYQPYVWSAQRDEPRELAILCDLSACVVTTAPAYRAPGDQPSHRWFSNWTGGKWQLSNLRLAAARPELLPLRPANWPSLAIDLNRWVGTNRFWATANVAVTDPIGGERLTLHLRTHTTTLRGARRQRAAGGGWASAGQPTLDDGP